MKKQILMLSAVAMIMIASCSKSKDEPKEETVSCQITEKTSTNGKTTYTYHSDGKLASAKEGDYQETYTYAANLITWKFVEPSGSTATMTYTLDAQGLVKASTDGTTTNLFSYDANGYLTEVKSNGSYTIKFTWSNGNLTKVEGITSSSTSITNLEYGPESRPLSFNDDISSHLWTSVWHDGDRQILAGSAFGKQPKNLVSKVTSNSNNYQYTYTKDTNGNVTKVAIAAGLNSSSSEFKYSCK